jgi:hypothetical protein
MQCEQLQIAESAAAKDRDKHVEVSVRYLGGLCSWLESGEKAAENPPRLALLS